MNLSSSAHAAVVARPASDTDPEPVRSTDPTPDEGPRVVCGLPASPGGGPEPSSPVPREVLTFRVGPSEFAVDILSVQEIRPMVASTTGALPGTEGSVNLRGRVLPVIDGRARLNVPPADRADPGVLLVLQLRGRVLGLVVDTVSDVRVVDDLGRAGDGADGRAGDGVGHVAGERVGDGAGPGPAPEASVAGRTARPGRPRLADLEAWFGDAGPAAP